MIWRIIGWRGLMDIADQLFGPIGGVIFLAVMIVVLEFAFGRHRQWDLYKWIMRDKAKPYVPFEERYEARIAEAKAREASLAASAAARREAEMAARRAIMAEVDRAPQPQEEDGGKEAVPGEAEDTPDKSREGQ